MTAAWVIGLLVVGAFLALLWMDEPTRAERDRAERQQDAHAAYTAAIDAARTRHPSRR